MDSRRVLKVFFNIIQAHTYNESWNSKTTLEILHYPRFVNFYKIRHKSKYRSIWNVIKTKSAMYTTMYIMYNTMYIIYTRIAILL